MATRKPRKTASAAKIRVHTDDYGRKVYTVVGSKKFAYTLAKAKEIASKSKKRKSTKASSSSTAMTVRTRKPAKRAAAKRTTAKRATSAKRKTTARKTTTRKGGATRNSKGQFVKRGSKKTPVRRNPTATERRAQAGDDRMFGLSVTMARKVGERAVRHRMAGGKFTAKRTHRPVYEEVLAEGATVHGRSAAIAEATRMMSDAIGAANVRKYFYRQDTDRGPEAGLVQFFPKAGTDGEFTGHATIEPLSR